MPYLYIIIILSILLASYILLCYHRLTTLYKQVKENSSSMDLYLKERWDLIPHVIETTKGYVSHESYALEKVLRAKKAKTAKKLSFEERDQENEELSRLLSELCMAVENYPALKSSKQYREIQGDLAEIEQEIRTISYDYNNVVNAYNDSVSAFPDCIIAKLFSMKKVNTFQVGK